jgi:sulfate transport system ATP-binding protein
MSIKIENVRKSFGNFHALDGVNLEIPSGELVALLGPSGSGKTTLLRILAGLEAADSGRILVEGRDTTEDHVRERQVGFVFQHYALFRHLTIFENVAYGLRVKPRATRPDKEYIHNRVTELLKLVQLDWLGDRYPAQLSGGQRQRIALARALAVEPRLLLLDEPFGALDAKVRLELRHWLRRLHDDLGITSVFVTHDQEEAMEVSDRVVILNAGQIEQVGTPEEVYDAPATPFVHEFLGLTNLFTGHLRQEVLAAGRNVKVTEETALDDKQGAHAYVRPYDFEVSLQADGEDYIPAELKFAQTIGNIVRLQFAIPGREEPVRVELEKTKFRALRVGIGAKLFLKPRHVQIFVKDRKDEAAWAGTGS